MRSSTSAALLWSLVFCVLPYGVLAGQMFLQMRVSGRQEDSRVCWGRLAIPRGMLEQSLRKGESVGGGDRVRPYQRRKMALVLIELVDTVTFGEELAAMTVNFTQQTGITVEEIPDYMSLYAPDTNTYHDLAHAWLLAQNPYLEVLQIDNVYTALYSENLVNIWDFNPDAGKAFDPNILTNFIVDGRLVALPAFNSLGILLFRTDLLKKYGFDVSGPSTWQEIEEQALVILAGERKLGNTALVGFAGQFLNYEGLTCNACEWFFNNTIIDLKSGNVTIDAPFNRDMTQMMQRWIEVGIIDPVEVTWTENEAYAQWFAGEAIFIRYWNDWIFTTIQVDFEYGFRTLPNHVGVNGAQGYGINKWSTRQQEAVQVVEFLTSAENIKFKILNPKVAFPLSCKHDGNVAPTHEVDPEICNFVGQDLCNVTRSVTVVNRPVTRTGGVYPAVSATFFDAIHNMIAEQLDVVEGFQTMENAIQAVLGIPLTCPAGTEAGIFGSTGIATCIGCSASTYNQDYDSTCKPCILGGYCPGGSVILAGYGYWQDPAQANIENAFIECPDETCCPTQGCTMDSPCSNTYTGLVCSACPDGFYPMPGECTQCDGLLVSRSLVIGELFKGLLVVSLFYWTPKSLPILFPDDLKIWQILFYQLTATIPSSTSLFSLGLNNIATYLLLRFLNRSSCGATFRIQVKLFAPFMEPLVLLLLLASIMIASRTARYLAQDSPTLSDLYRRVDMYIPSTDFKSNALTTAIKLAMFSYGPLVYACWGILSCKKIGNYGQFSVGQFEAKCWEGPHIGPAVFAIMMLLALVIAPLYLFYKRTAKRTDLQPSMQHHPSKRSDRQFPFSLLTLPYNEDWRLWPMEKFWFVSPLSAAIPVTGLSHIPTAVFSWGVVISICLAVLSFIQPWATGASTVFLILPVLIAPTFSYAASFVIDTGSSGEVSSKNFFGLAAMTFSAIYAPPLRARRHRVLSLLKAGITDILTQEVEMTGRVRLDVRAMLSNFEDRSILRVPVFCPWRLDVSAIGEGRMAVGSARDDWHSHEARLTDLLFQSGNLSEPIRLLSDRTLGSEPFSAELAAMTVNFTQQTGITVVEIPDYMVSAGRCLPPFFLNYGSRKGSSETLCLQSLAKPVPRSLAGLSRNTYLSAERLARSPSLTSNFIRKIDNVYTALYSENLVNIWDFNPDAGKAFDPNILTNFIVDGRLVALPAFDTYGILLFRADLLEKYGFDVSGPSTWQKIEEQALVILAGERKLGDNDLVGFAGQFLNYEGLTCNACEVIGLLSHSIIIEPLRVGGGGGRQGEASLCFFDDRIIYLKSGNVTVNTPFNREILQIMHRWMDLGIIDPVELTWTEVEAYAQWYAEEAIFIRYWNDWIFPTYEVGFEYSFRTLPHSVGVNSAQGQSRALEQIGYECKFASKIQEISENFCLFEFRYIPFDAPIPLFVYCVRLFSPLPSATHPSVQRIAGIHSHKSPVTRTEGSYPAVSSIFFDAIHNMVAGQLGVEDGFQTIENAIQAVLGIPLTCPEGTEAGIFGSTGRSACIACSANTFNQEYDSNCILGAYCPGGSAILAATGYWQDPAESNVDDAFIECPAKTCECTFSKGTRLTACPVGLYPMPGVCAAGAAGLQHFPVIRDFESNALTTAVKVAILCYGPLVYACWGILSCKKIGSHGQLFVGQFEAKCWEGPHITPAVFAIIMLLVLATAPPYIFYQRIMRRTALQPSMQHMISERSRNAALANLRYGMEMWSFLVLVYREKLRRLITSSDWGFRLGSGIGHAQYPRRCFRLLLNFTGFDRTGSAHHCSFPKENEQYPFTAVLERRGANDGSDLESWQPPAEM
ncbi:hypothetical protein BDK51DRAFT_34461 [Blyttiomyces helicus]|uniref:Uncharacterized protein n=1 Tax=Blyttiomyces helicus TaxID=388810 RepID=A0A4P9WNG0_9FUNG|nr:hypothetical protein BDK51DRAFT_34461 [Blyttiomyces helicus]|eukprot:RKO94032.1 hypothetical protein BDK51DRAFT_34461 [Blyttiomyces helicus]